METAIESAAKARQVPLPLLQAIAYINTRWELNTPPAGNGGFGPMNLLPPQLDHAAAVSGHTVAELKTDPAANLDAGAALLASVHTGTGLASWQPATSAILGPFVAAQVFDTLRRGESRTTSAGEIITLAPQVVPATQPAPKGAAAALAPVGPAAATTDFPGASWVPASSANFSSADRPHDFPVDMIVIHDTEGSYGSAIQEFQNPATQASAHYVVSTGGAITQMVLENDIAWHAGNWDFNTRAIGVEHEGFAWSAYNYYTTAEYQASAHLIASICSRWGVPMDRSHVIGHYQVPDPDNPGQFGGAGHHTDPGGNWDWAAYMSYAVSYANALPSPPRMMTDPITVETGSSATVTWPAAHTCHLPVDSYTVVQQPGNVTQTLPANATSATFSGLQSATSYSFTVTARNADGTSSSTSNKGPWKMQENRGGPIGSGPSVASWSPDRMDVFYRASDGRLGHQVALGSSWVPAATMGGVLTAAPAAISWGPGRIDVFVRGGDFQLYHQAWANSMWSGWEGLGGYLASAPAVASWSENRLDVFVRGGDNQLYQKVWDGTGWSGWSPQGGVLTSAPAAVSWSAGRIDVFVRGGDMQMYSKAWNGTYWTSWQGMPGPLASAPAASSWQVGRLDIIALTPGQAIQHQSWNGSAWSGWQQLGASQWQADPAVLARSAGLLDIFAQGPDSDLWHMGFRAG